MGHPASKHSEVRVLLLGLDNAGKSTLLYKLKHNVCVGTTPTIGFNVEMIAARKGGKNVALTVWDVGGQRRMRPHWRSFHHDAAAVAFVVDSSDTGRLDESRRELERTLRSKHLQGRPVVVLANKQDVSGSLTVTELTERLDLAEMCSGRDWFVQPCSASTGFGLEEGFKRVARLLRLPSEPESVKENIRDTVHYLKAKSTRRA